MHNIYSCIEQQYNIMMLGFTSMAFYFNTLKRGKIYCFFRKTKRDQALSVHKISQ